MNDMSDVLRETLGEIDFDPAALKSKYLSERDKRLRADANDQYIAVKGDFSNFVDAPYVERIERAPLFDTVEVAVIGGGFGGLMMGGRLREAGFDDIRVIDKVAISAAPGTGTAIRARAATLKACNIPIPFPKNCSRNGTGPNGFPPSRKSWNTPIMSPTGSSRAATLRFIFNVAAPS